MWRKVVRNKTGQEKEDKRTQTETETERQGLIAKGIPCLGNFHSGQFP